MKSLVGYTGFVGSNLARQEQFDGLYNSKNIGQAFGSKPDLLVYCGVRAEKFLANNDPEKDYESILEANRNIEKINPKKLVLISTIDVYKNAVDVDEDTIIDMDSLHPYGLNRYRLEQMVAKSGIDTLIMRLPGLYGENIKKNFIYDLIHIIPSMLTEQKYRELAEKDHIIQQYYENQGNGFYKCMPLEEKERKELKSHFEQLGFSALNFTDSRGVYQFYNLKYLWGHLSIALEKNIPLLNIATEPVMISELYRYIKGKEFINELNKPIPVYDFRTKYASLFSSGKHYILDKDIIMSDIKKFVGV